MGNVEQSDQHRKHYVDYTVHVKKASKMLFSRNQYIVLNPFCI